MTESRKNKFVSGKYLIITTTSKGGGVRFGHEEQIQFVYPTIVTYDRFVKNATKMTIFWSEQN